MLFMFLRFVCLLLVYAYIMKKPSSLPKGSEKGLRCMLFTIIGTPYHFPFFVEGEDQ